MNKNAIKKIPVEVSVNDESFDNCLGCQSETHTSELNLVTGLCSVCNANKIKLTKEKIIKLLELDKGLHEN
tara:strand:+ start:1394 stop:1606 length:213 start_codon:yes stop_codon:yes gene_type:complete